MRGVPPLNRAGRLLLSIHSRCHAPLNRNLGSFARFHATNDRNEPGIRARTIARSRLNEFLLRAFFAFTCVLTRIVPIPLLARTRAGPHTRTHTHSLTHTHTHKPNTNRGIHTRENVRARFSYAELQSLFLG